MPRHALPTREELNPKLLEALAVAVAFAVYLYPLRDLAILFTFQTRDTLRTIELLHGHPIFFGPEVTGGGHLPGPLYYFLLAVPLGLGLGWKGTWLLLAIFQGVAAGGTWLFFRAVVGGFLPALFALACFATALPMCAGIRSILNSEYIFPFATCALALLCVAFSPAASLRARRRALRIAFLALGFGLQLHFSLISVVPAIFLLQLFGGGSGLARFRWPDFFRGAAFLVLPLTPFLLWRLLEAFGVHVGQQPPAFIGVGGLGNFFRFPYGNMTWQAWQMNLYFSVGYAFRQLIYQLHTYVLDTGLLTLPCYAISALWIARRFVGRARGWRPGAEEGVSLVLFACAVCAFSSGLVGAGSAGALVRYSGISSLAYLFFCAAAIERLLFAARRRLGESVPGAAGVRKAFLLAGIGACVLYVAHDGARSEAFEKRYEANVWALETLVPAAEFEGMSRHVLAATGWPYSVFRERAFVVNVFNEITPQANYEEVEAREKQLVRSPAADGPDGYFVAKRISGKDTRESEADFLRWLRTQRLPASIDEGLKTGAITLGPTAKFGTILAAPYRVKDRARFPAHFQNRSEHYENEEESRIEAALAEQRAAPSRTLVAEFNNCPGREWYCRFAFVLKSEDLGDPSLPVRAEVLGLGLSMPSQYYNPGWTQAILEPYLTYRCEGAREAVKELIAPAVGLYVDQTWILNHSFLSPYARELSLHCPRGARVKSFSLGFGRSMTTSYLKEAVIPGQEQAYTLPR